MDKVKKFFTGAWDVTSRLLAGKATESDKALVGLTAVILCLAALAIITIEAWLPLAALAALCYLVYHKEPNSNALTMPYQDVLLLNITEAVNRIHDIFGLCYVDPREIADVLVSHSIDAAGVKRAVLQYKVSKPTTSGNEEWAAVVKQGIQQEVNALLRMGKVVGLTRPSIDGKTPIIYVESVVDMGTCINVTAIIVDSQAAVLYVGSKATQQQTPQCPPATDEDF